MKTILWMSLGMCLGAGMSGYGMEEIVTTSGLPEPPLKRSTSETNGDNLEAAKKVKKGSPIQITEVLETQRKGFSVYRSPEAREAFQAFTQMSSETSNVLYSWLNSTALLEESGVREAIRILAKTYQDRLDAIDLKYKKDPSNQGNSMQDNVESYLDDVTYVMITTLDDLWYGFDGITPSNADTTRAREILILLGSTPPGEAPSETYGEE